MTQTFRVEKSFQISGTAFTKGDTVLAVSLSGGAVHLSISGTTKATHVSQHVLDRHIREGFLLEI